jgi:hypothetical protein
MMLSWSTLITPSTHTTYIHAVQIHGPFVQRCLHGMAHSCRLTQLQTCRRVCSINYLVTRNYWDPIDSIHMHQHPFQAVQ